MAYLSPLDAYAPVSLAHLIKNQPFVRDHSSSSTSSLSLSSTPTLFSTSSRALSSSDLDTPLESPSENGPSDSSKPYSRINRKEFGISSFPSSSYFGLDSISDADDEEGYDSDVEDSFQLDRTIARRKPRSATLHLPRERKAGLPYHRPNVLKLNALGAESVRLPSIASLSCSSEERTRLESIMLLSFDCFVNNLNLETFQSHHRHVL